MPVPRRLKIMAINAENLFLYLDKFEGEDLSKVTEEEWQSFSISLFQNKTLYKTRWLARSIEDVEPDVVMLSEVGGLESIRNFSRLFLKDKYEPFLIEGNSNRGIDLGYLVRRSSNIEAELISHKNRSINFLYPHEKYSLDAGYKKVRGRPIEDHKFSRDLVQLNLREATSVVADKDLAATNPFAVLLLAHFKSKLDSEGLDPDGKDRRKAEVKTAVKIYNEVRTRYGREVPVLLGGDLNGTASGPHTEDEFKVITSETDLIDSLIAAGKSSEERITYVHVTLPRAHQKGPKRPNVYKQLDYIFVPKAWESRVVKEETYVYLYKDEEGIALNLPELRGYKQLLPSDHYPVVLTLDL